MILLYTALGAGVFALLFALVTSQRVLREETGNDTMRRIAALIQEGAAAFLRREYTFLSGFVALVAVLIAAFVDYDVTGARSRGAGAFHRPASDGDCVRVGWFRVRGGGVRRDVHRRACQRPHGGEGP
jgi:Na+/H+-translocating membrane pyrophosphatase